MVTLAPLRIAKSLFTRSRSFGESMTSNEQIDFNKSSTSKSSSYKRMMVYYNYKRENTFSWCFCRAFSYFFWKTIPSNIKSGKRSTVLKGAPQSETNQRNRPISFEKTFPRQTELESIVVISAKIMINTEQWAILKLTCHPFARAGQPRNDAFERVSPRRQILPNLSYPPSDEANEELEWSKDSRPEDPWGSRIQGQPHLRLIPIQLLVVACPDWSIITSLLKFLDFSWK